MTIAAILGGCLLCSLAMTRWALGYARRRGMFDAVNERSSHSTPTPRGGGIAIVASALASFVVAHLLIGGSAAILVGLTGGGIGVAMIGWIDDKGHINPIVRLGVHVLAGAWLIWWIGGALDYGPFTPFAIRLLVAIILVLMIAWMINLYNFMDGIDGLAASEAITVSIGSCLVMLASGASTLVEVVPGLVLAAATLGFLPSNWPPARIFMGDASSGFLGFVLGGLIVIAAGRGVAEGAGVVMLLGTFLADTGVTLTRRILSGQPIHQAHRSHAYQILARRWRSHRGVTLVNLAITIFWLGPLALLVSARLVPLIPTLLVGLLPLVLLAWNIGAGRKNT